MFLPHLIDFIRGHTKAPPDARLTLAKKEYLDAFIRDVESADKFDFGALPLEVIDEEDMKGYTLPPLTETELAFWADGYVPLPRPEGVWFEFVSHGFYNGFLLTENPRWTLRRVEYGKSPHDAVFTVFVDEMTLTVPDRNCVKSGDLIGVLNGDTSIYEKWEQDYGVNGWGETPVASLQRHMTAKCKLSIYLTLMLNSRSTDIMTSVPPEKLNKARLKAGRTLLPTHRIVTIVPKRYVQHDSCHGVHASPKLHWRRSHLRELRKENGDVYHRVVIPRHLVGKRELGEITHEYRVKNGTQIFLTPEGNRKPHTAKP